MRDLARRVQALRKELGFMPTDILDSVHIAELDAENMPLLEPYLRKWRGLSEPQSILAQQAAAKSKHNGTNQN